MFTAFVISSYIQFQITRIQNEHIYSGNVQREPVARHLPLEEDDDDDAVIEGPKTKVLLLSILLLWLEIPCSIIMYLNTDLVLEAYSLHLIDYTFTLARILE